MLRDIVFYFFTIFFLSILLPVETISQVIIKERVEILPVSPGNEPLPYGSISGDFRNPFYLGYGGNVTLRTIHSSNPNLEL